MINEKIPPPPEILELVEKQRAWLLEGEKQMNELRQAMAATSEETQRREELAEQILEKFGRQWGIASELKELSRLLRAPDRRVQEVVDRYFRLQEEYSDQDERR